FWHWLGFEVNGALRSTPFLVILLFALLNLAFTLAEPATLYGAANYPVTFLVVETIHSSPPLNHNPPHPSQPHTHTPTPPHAPHRAGPHPLDLSNQQPSPHPTPT